MSSFSEDKDPKPAPKDVPLEIVNDVPDGAQRGGGTSDDSTGSSRVGTSPFRFGLSLLIGALADWLELLFPFAWVPIDCVTAAVFFMLWGLRWETALVLIPELIPGLNVFPSWLLLAFYLGQKGRSSQPGPR